MKNIRKTPAYPRQHRLSAPMVLRQGKRRVFWIAAAMCVLWLIRAAMPQTTAQRITAIILCRLFFAAVLVFGRPDSMYWYPVAVNALMLRRFRRQPVCQTNRHRTPRPTATPDLPPPKACATPAALRKSGAASSSSTAQPPPFWQACNITTGGRLIPASCRMC